MNNILNFLDVKDDKKTDILLNERFVYLVDNYTIQVEQKLVNKFSENTLHILYRKKPEMLSVDKSIQEQYVDLPIALLECLITGVTYYAHSIGVISQDASKYGAALTNYKKRYDEAIQNAMAYQIVQSTSNKDEAVFNGGFF